MSRQVKICGLTRPEDIDALNRLPVTMAGFVFHKASPRHLSDDQAAQLAARCAPQIHRVALLVDPDDAAIDAALGAVSPTHLQLHGHESPARMAEIKRRSHCALIKALPIASADDFALCADYAGLVDMFLFDAKPPKDGLPGGNGLAFDWSLMKAYDQSQPYLLAGGRTAENVEAALRQTGAPYADVSSGVESAPGVKDAALMEAFVTAAQAV